MSILQNSINLLYRHPRGKWKNIQRQGGILNTLRIEGARKKMEQASRKLFIPEKNQANALNIHFLTGKKYWYQTVFCIKSLSIWCEESFCFHIQDDGSFDQNDIAQIKSQVPNAIVTMAQETTSRLDKYLPEQQFPFLRKKRLVYPHLKKLTDIHIGRTGYNLVLDSDMLFFSYPKMMIDWLKRPTQLFHLVDQDNFYGYSLDLMEKLTGNKVPHRLNVGIIGLNSETIPWDKLEEWGRELEEKEGTSYFLEQALSAMLASTQIAMIGPKEDYIIMPDKDQVFQKKGILHHYVDLSKEWYFKEAWTSFAK